MWLITNRWLTWFHRWAGVALCLIFAMWFASGAVLHFVGFPSLPDQERHRASPAIEVQDVTVLPLDAVSKIPAAQDVRLVSRAGAAAYLLQSPKGFWFPVDARSGARLPDLSRADAQAIAESFSGSPADSVSDPLSYDQWVVHQRFDPFRPFFRVRLRDESETDLYVSARTGEVLQRTRFSERAWNWVGAVIHWLYFTPLRHTWAAWNQVVWWLSLLALISIGVGTWLGIVRTIANRTARRKGYSPYRGWMRWHHLVGLFASVISLTWMLSGWLSMDHGRFFSMGQPTAADNAHLSGMTLEDRLKPASLEALRALRPASEIDFNAIAGRPFLTAFGPMNLGNEVVFLDDSARSLATIPDSVLLTGLKYLWPGATLVADHSATDALYRRAESTGNDAAAFAEGQPISRRAYLDPLTGRFIVVMDTSRRSYAWIYYALHTLQFPGLIGHPGLRTSLVLSFLLLGFASSVTGIVLSVKRLRHQFA